MSEEINNHVILNHLDAPMRILLWPAEQVIACMFPLMLCIAVEQFCLGIVSSLVASFGFKSFKEKFGDGKLRAILYENFPTPEKLVQKGLPPSHVRVWHK